jgi:hypothetical protein
LSAAPAAAVDSGRPDPEADEDGEPDSEPDPLVPVAVGLAELAPVPAAGLALLGAAAPAPAGLSTKAVWLLGKWLVMQDWTHLE